MKTIYIVTIFLFFSTKLFAQSSTVQPELFRVPIAISLFEVCTESTNGKLFFSSGLNSFNYCYGTNAYKKPLEKWEANQSGIYYLGKVGIGASSVTYDLQTLADPRAQALIVGGNIGINTTEPTEKLEVKDRSIRFISTTNPNGWELRNSDVEDRFVFQGAGEARMSFMYGGNIKIGDIPEIAKLNVAGDASYAGSVSVEGKGTLANSNASQLVLRTITSNATEASFQVDNNTCNTSAFTFSNTAFSQPPVVVLGQKNGGTYTEAKLVISVENVTTAGGVLRFCNNSGANIALPTTTFALTVISQQ